MDVGASQGRIDLHFDWLALCDAISDVTAAALSEAGPGGERLSTGGVRDTGKGGEEEDGLWIRLE
jgi:hypothetical protein